MPSTRAMVQEHRVRRRGCREPGMVRVGSCLEGDQVVGIRPHPGQPVDDELVGLPAVQAQGGQGVLQKGGGLPAWDAEALGEVIFRPADALPVEVIVGLAGLVRQCPIGTGGSLKSTRSSREISAPAGTHVIDTPPQTVYLSGKDQEVVQVYFGNSPKGSLLITLWLQEMKI